jgi:hypothetical protein
MVSLMDVFSPEDNDKREAMSRLLRVIPSIVLFVGVHSIDLFLLLHDDRKQTERNMRIDVYDLHAYHVEDVNVGKKYTRTVRVVVAFDDAHRLTCVTNYPRLILMSQLQRQT